MCQIVTPIEGHALPETQPSDAELVVEMCAQRADALERLFQRYVRLVTGIAQRILHDRGEAEDVTQEVFLEIYRKAHLYSPERGTFRVWLLQYVYHRTLRRKAVLRRRAAYCGDPIETLDEVSFDHRRGLSRDECRWVLHSLIDRLPSRQRITLELTCFEDLPLRDVAERLGVSVGCTRHYYYRGLARLQQWARVNEARGAAQPADASTAGTTDDVTGRDRPRYVRN